MNEHERSSQLSALFDGELPVEQAGMVIRRAMKDGQMRASWGRYALIGAAIRNEPLAVRTRLGDDVAARVAARLSAETPIASPAMQSAAQFPPQRAGRSQFAKGAWGMAVAASVAAVSLIVLRSQAPAQPGSPALVAQASRPDAALGVASPPAPLPSVALPAGGVQMASVATPRDSNIESLPSYTTPLGGSDSASRFGQPLVNYVVAHSEVTTSAVRLSPLSTVMSAGQDITQGTVEMTEAEIGAHR
jgi:sigma-E factor negative regulatory protein RseA